MWIVLLVGCTAENGGFPEFGISGKLGADYYGGGLMSDTGSAGDTGGDTNPDDAPVLTAAEASFTSSEYPADLYFVVNYTDPQGDVVGGTAFLNVKELDSVYVQLTLEIVDDGSYNDYTLEAGADDDSITMIVEEVNPVFDYTCSVIIKDVTGNSSNEISAVASE